MHTRIGVLAFPQVGSIVLNELTAVRVVRVRIARMVSIFLIRQGVGGCWIRITYDDGVGSGFGTRCDLFVLVVMGNRFGLFAGATRSTVLWTILPAMKNRPSKRQPISHDTNCFLIIINQDSVAILTNR